MVARRELYLNYKNHKILKHALEHYIEHKKMKLYQGDDEKLKKDITEEQTLLDAVLFNLERFPDGTKRAKKDWEE